MSKAIEEKLDERLENQDNEDVQNNPNNQDSQDNQQDNQDSQDNQQSNQDLIELPSGEKISKEELVSGYMRQQDYTQKTQELAETRHQLELARENISKKTPEETKDTKEALQGEQQDIEKALDLLDPDDPQAKILKGLYMQNKYLLDYINKKETEASNAQASEQMKKDIEHFQKFTKENIDTLSKEFNLPKLKSPEGKEIDFRKNWEEMVYTALSSIDQQMTIPEYRNLIRQVGQKAYERLRDMIGAINAQAVKAKKTPASPQGPGRGAAKPKPEGLEAKLEHAFDKILEQKGG